MSFGSKIGGRAGLHLWVSRQADPDWDLGVGLPHPSSSLPSSIVQTLAAEGAPLASEQPRQNHSFTSPDKLSIAGVSTETSFTDHLEISDGLSYLSDTCRVPVWINPTARLPYLVVDEVDDIVFQNLRVTHLGELLAGRANVRQSLNAALAALACNGLSK